MKIARTRTASAAALVALAAALVGCSSSSSSAAPAGNALTNQLQQNDDDQLSWVQPLPYFPFSQIRQNVIEAEAIDALGIASTTFFFVPGINHPVLQCPSVGVPVPATDQLSNPQVAQWNANTYNNDGIAGVTVGQEEPDGVFTGDTTGTNSICLTSSGGQYLGYNEAYDIAVTAPAYWDNTTGTIHIDGTPVMPVCVVKILNAAKKQAEEVCTDPAKSK